MALGDWKKIRFDYRITTTYLAIGFLWIFFSDKILNRIIFDKELITKFQTYKGSFYVILTSLLLFFLVKKHIQRQAKIEALKNESEGRYMALFYENNSVILLIDPDTEQIVDANNAALEYYGYTREEITSLKIGKINILPPQKLKQEIDNAVSLRKRYFNFQHQLKSGEIREVEVYSGRIIIGTKPLLYSTVHDITDVKPNQLELQRKNEEYASLNEEYLQINEELTQSMESIMEVNTKLAQSEEQFRLMAENAPEAIFIQTDWHFAYVNKQAIKLFGAKSSEDLLGKPVMERFHPSYYEKVKQRIAGLNDKKEIQTPLEQIFIRLDGSYVDVESSGVPFTYKNKHGALVFVRDITERKKSKERITSLSSIIENSLNEIFVFDITTLKFRFANNAALTNLGYTEEELLQLTPLEVKPLYSRESFINMLTPLLNGENPILHLETKHKRKDGTEYPIEVHLQLSEYEGKRSVAAIVVDITQRKNAELEIIAAREKIEASAMQLRLISNNFTNGMVYQTVSTDETHRRFTYLSDSVNKFYGCTPEEAIANPELIYRRVHKDDVERMISEGAAAYKQMSVFKSEIRVNAPDGTIRWALLVSSPRKHKGLIYWDGIEVDITQQKRVEQELKLAKEKAEKREHDIKLINEEYETLNEELRQTNEELYRAKEKAEEGNQLKTAFLQNMSHEIRTPMNAIIGFSQLLNKQELEDEKRKDFTNIIINSTNQLLSIVNDVLTISSLETKQEKLTIQKVCINSILTELFTIFKGQADHHQLSFISKPQLDDAQSEIFTDRTKLTQILSNLLANSLKFTKEGYVEFGYSLDNGELEFYVKDTGIGIQANMQEKIFERFNQADISISKKYGGTGLGLAISKAFVELLGGRIWVESEQGKGATFYFTIPYNPSHSLEEVVVTTPPEKKQKATILVAEDEEYNYMLIAELLADTELKLIHSKNGEETVGICKENPEVNLILMDIKMPIMDGYTAAKEIKSFRPELPIVAQSAYAMEHEIEQYGNIFDDYITKPIKSEALQQSIKRYLGKPRRT